MATNHAPSITVHGSPAAGFSARVFGRGLAGEWTQTRPFVENAIGDARDLLSAAGIPDDELRKLWVHGARLGEIAGVSW